MVKILAIVFFAQYQKCSKNEQFYIRLVIFLYPAAWMQIQSS